MTEFQTIQKRPFNLGDHVRYVGVQERTLAATERVLVSGMEGVVVLSPGTLTTRGVDSLYPWHCQIQFRNGFQLEITLTDFADFEMAQ